MASLPTVTRLIAEDVPSKQQQWIAPVFQLLNTFISSTVSALNKRLTFQENFNAFIKQVEFNEIGSDTYPLTFKNNLNTVPIGILKIKLEDITETGAIAFIKPVDIDWSYTQEGKIQITNITNIDSENHAGTKYRLTLLIF